MAGTQSALKSVDTLAPHYDGPIFDGDTHIQEKDYSFFEKYLPEKYHAEWLPARKYGPDGSFGLYIGDTKAENAELQPGGLIPPPGKLKEWLRAISTGETVDSGFTPTPDMSEVGPRLAKLEEFEVEGSIMFVGEFVATFGVLGQLVEEKGPEGANALFHAWNEYLVKEWTLNVQDRIYPTAILALFDLDWAVQEAKWLVENGVRVVVMPMGPVDGKSPADPYFDPLWQVLNDAGVAVTFHVSEANFMHGLIYEWGEKPLQSRKSGQSAWQWMFAYSEIPVMMTMANFIYWNFFERFPNIKMASVENGAEWLPRFLYKMDKMRGMARSGWWPMGQLKERPSTIFKRNCFVVAYPEDDIKGIVDQLGGDASCILMGSDYPHAEGVPTPRDFVEEGCKGLTPEQIEQIMYSNGRRMMPKGRTGLSG
ncbi:amidohydrolase family protein [Sphingobium sp. HBC34]|uniref:Amidohydrolase family protein n=1 Tax=Sphingobium cyanobacteriorum TaxID=3063954 RepID=A0ABT8ZGD8_9SPHN|nr:amidohydrolase family protein [Sphingobium sp. HBC34]MDO7833461.1 amidohydrolase family protein [Sphingobium sp. HBC34]